jgi:hypothetical protein
LPIELCGQDPGRKEAERTGRNGWESAHRGETVTDMIDVGFAVTHTGGYGRVAHDDAVGTAWQLHASLSDWTGKIDSKASFALSLESAALAGVAALAGPGHRFGRLSGFWAVGGFWLGVVLLGVAAIIAVAVVVPRGRGDREEGPPTRDDFIFYGHLRHWTPEELAAQLAEADVLAALSRQLVVSSKIAWTKHRRVQQSLILAVAGAALLGVVGVSG